MSQQKNPKAGWMRRYSKSTGKNASLRLNKEMLNVEVSGTPDLNRYYETGQLPENEVEREMYKEMEEKGLI